MKHFGEFLSFAGRVIKKQAFDISLLMIKKERLQKELEQLDERIVEEEKELMYDVQKEWAPEEIQEAQQEAEKYNNNLRTKK